MSTPSGTTVFQRTAFEDALGARHHADASGEPLEVFELREEFSTEAFEAAVRERGRQLAGLQSTWFARVRTLQRLKHNAKLFVVSDRVTGARLSTVLAGVRADDTPFDFSATICVVRQLVSAIALLHEKRPGLAHGAISAERIVITPEGRLVVVEHVLGGALEELQYSRERYWRQLRIAVPSGVTLNQRADVLQIGVLALELMLGRPIGADEYPDRLTELFERAWDATRALAVPPAGLHEWLSRVLQLDLVHAFASAVEAWEELERVLSATENGASFAALEALMARHARRTAPSAMAATRTRIAVAAAASGAPAEVAPTEVAPAAPPADVGPTPAAADPVPEPPPLTFTPPVPQRPQPAHAGLAVLVGRRWVAAAAVLVLLVSAGAMAGRRYFFPTAAAEATGTLIVNTNPPGYQVFIDGQPRGVTPLTLELAPGDHELKLATNDEPRIIPFTLAPGNTVSQTIELARVAPLTGQLMIRTDPPGANVVVDDVLSGVTPITVDGLTPGPHRVQLSNDLGSLLHEVIIEAGATASLVVPMTAPRGVPVSGWVSIDAPAELQVFEAGRLLGTSASERIMMAAGRHDLELVNATLGFTAAQTVVVSPGRVTPIRLQWPRGTMALNAQPWADVWVNGEKIGETPIGRLTVPIGTHEIVFRHPEFGEQVVRATVTTTTPARVSVDMRKR